MEKWQEVRGISPQKSDALISAGCRYLNATRQTQRSVKVLASIIGLEEIESDEEQQVKDDEGQQAEDDEDTDEEW